MALTMERARDILDPMVGDIEEQFPGVELALVVQAGNLVVIGRGPVLSGEMLLATPADLTGSEWKFQLRPRVEELCWNIAPLVKENDGAA